MDEDQNDTALKKIIDNWDKIKNSLFASELSGPLIQERIITPEQWMDIKSRPKSDPDKIDEFLCIVKKQNPATHDAFVKILTEKGFDWNTNLNEASFVGGSSREKKALKASADVTSSAQNDHNKMKEELKKEFSEEMDKKIKENNSMMLEKMSESLQKYMEFYKEKELECQELTVKNKNLQKDLILQKTNHMKTLEMLEKEKEKLNNELQKKEGEYTELRNKLKEWKDSDKERVDNLKTLREDVYGLTNAKKEAETKVRHLQEEVKELESKVSKQMSLHDEKMSYIKQLEDQNKALKKRVGEIEKDNALMRKENKTLERDLQKAKVEKEASDIKLAEIRRIRAGQSKKGLKFGKPGI